MPSGRTRLLDAATELLAAQPSHEPSTRELYEAAGVAAPTLYHHFGTKEGLLDAVVERAFADYLQRKHGMLRTGDLVTDFCAGWDLHVEFGVANPTLYALMYSPGRVSAAAATADTHLRAALERMRDAGLLRVDVDTAAAMTTGMAIGCVTQLNRQHRPVDNPAALATRAALIEQLTGQSSASTSPDQAARALLRELPEVAARFTSAESALLTQWLRAIAEEERAAAPPKGSRP
ncbi:TetR/AcrR family transcriptional regulator [Allobranchiibius sp. CTAmp26]|uniref:TetR/AcrR family transcriptional regulator n=1 Tax=Allobranchiibius sp. CTAmp26 TaxID=2815214 RepID=UPI001AA19F49|nr:TetR/AcrR family transcriptional regulator [Allobranchiibius sp. CTAmp26]MBO1753909.1 TetR/AcrR family transcriptional regulator [Allobranchiibius sp. CTAmp26]